MKNRFLIVFCSLCTYFLVGQNITITMLRIPDTGQNKSYTNTFGEDNDYNINDPYYINNQNGTITDTVTGLMWQMTDGGEMTVENAIAYCDTLALGGFKDWRLPSPHEAYSILNHQNNGPALNTVFFTKTGAEYWWTNTRQANDNTKVWVINAGGGIGNHLKSETISAGGTKKYHVRAVRDVNVPQNIQSRFVDHGDGTITDLTTHLVWQKNLNLSSINWEDALNYAEHLELASFNDWRLPNIKELESLNDYSLINPSINTTYFNSIGVKKYWSSTSLPNQITKAWYLNTQFGITTYDEKTVLNYVICVRNETLTTAIKNEPQTDAETFMVFPNPCKGNVNIYFLDHQHEYLKDITLTNQLGQVIYKCIADKHSDKMILDTENVLPGLYFVTIKLGNSRKTVRVCIQ